MPPLTDAALRRIRPSERTQKLFDGGGLYLEVSPKGGRWWRLKYRYGGKEKRLALGVYPMSKTQEQTATAPGVALETPIVRGEQTITHVELRKPKAGELRGVALTDLLRLDVAALQLVLPRVSNPTLTSADVAALEPHDLMQLGTEVLGFFMSKAERALATGQS